MSLGNCRLKNQCDTITHLLEWPKSKTPPNGGEAREQQELSFIAGESENDTTTLEDSVTVFFLQNLTYSYHMIQQSCSWLVTKISNVHTNEFMPTQSLHSDVYCHLIYTCPNLRAIKMSTS